MLTLEGFLKRLRKTPRNWQLIGGCLRMDIEHTRNRTWCACPITSLAPGGAATANQWRWVAGKLGLPLPLAKEIMHAADGTDNGLRKQLLDACGLKNEPC